MFQSASLVSCKFNHETERNVLYVLFYETEMFYETEEMFYFWLYLPLNHPSRIVFLFVVTLLCLWSTLSCQLCLAT